MEMKIFTRDRLKKGMRHVLFYAGLFCVGLMVFLFVAFRYLHVSTNSAVIYVLKDDSGLRIAKNITFSEAESLVYRFDATPLFNWIFEEIASATNRAYLDVEFDEENGKGVLKEFRPDGSVLEVALSRFDGEGISPSGLIIGGDFPPGDSEMHREGGGMALYDGSRWIHLWCTANEGIAASGGGTVYETWKWKYLSGRIVKETFDEILLESKHAVFINGVPVKITRWLGMKAGEDHLTLRIQVMNTGSSALLFDYAYGDEPWVGLFGSSEGEIGWHEGGWITRESYIDPLKYPVVGFSDIGNSEAGEESTYTGYSNFIQWMGPVPSQVYFSNDFYRVTNRVLDSPDNRVLNIVWKNQFLAPGQEWNFGLRIGFIPPGRDVFAEGRRIRNSVVEEKLFF